MPTSELFEWIYFIIACFNARLNFLIDDFDQLEAFYERGSEWLQKRQSAFHKCYFKNFQLVAMQHYANFLRACRKNEKAKQCLQYALEQCESQTMDIDVVYRINLKLQLLSTTRRIEPNKCMRINNTGKYSKLQRTLTFNVSPEENKEKHDKAKQDIKNQMLKQVMCSTKKPTSNGSGHSLTTTATKNNRGSANSSGKSSPENKSKTKTKLKFNICMDSIEILDLSTNNDVVDIQTTAKHDVKSTSPPNGITKTEQRISRKDKIPTKTSSKTKAISSQSMVTIDLLDSPIKSTPTMPSSSNSSSLESLETKENQKPENDLVKHMENLKMTETKTKTPSESRSRKTPSVRIPPSPPVIILDDSPVLKKPVEKTARSRSRLRNNKSPDILKGSKGKSIETAAPQPRSRLRSKSKDISSAIIKADKQESGVRRQRKVILVNNETPDSNNPTSTNSSVATSTSSIVSTRRRQKI